MQYIVSSKALVQFRSVISTCALLAADYCSCAAVQNTCTTPRTCHGANQDHSPGTGGELRWLLQIRLWDGERHQCGGGGLSQECWHRQCRTGELVDWRPRSHLAFASVAPSRTCTERLINCSGLVIVLFSALFAFCFALLRWTKGRTGLLFLYCARWHTHTDHLCSGWERLPAAGRSSANGTAHTTSHTEGLGLHSHSTTATGWPAERLHCTQRLTSQYKRSIESKRERQSFCKGQRQRETVC